MKTLRQARNEDRGMELQKVENMPSSAGNFRVWFNGVVLHSSKTLKSSDNKFNKLMKKWDMREFNVKLDMWECELN